MTVRAKFKVQKIYRSMGSKQVKDPVTGNYSYQPAEQQTVELHPVYSNEQGHENKTFWDATPAGKIELCSINPGANNYFELDKEYYIDFTKAE